jgi:5-methylcytosine-specific restriction endonuclease McrA
MDLACLNCDKLLASPKRPYLFCSALCRQEAHHVRYARAVARDGRLARPDVLEAVKIQRASVLSGGYPRKERTLTPELRAMIFARDDGRCRLCDSPATSIDHHPVDPTVGLNDPVNLRALCDECHRKKTLSGHRPIDPVAEPEVWRKAQELDARVLAPVPARLSDDEQRWAKAWRGIAKERTLLVKAG